MEVKQEQDGDAEKEQEHDDDDDDDDDAVERPTAKWPLPLAEPIIPNRHHSPTSDCSTLQILTTPAPLSLHFLQRLFQHNSSWHFVNLFF